MSDTSSNVQQYNGHRKECNLNLWFSLRSKNDLNSRPLGEYQ